MAGNTQRQPKLLTRPIDNNFTGRQHFASAGNAQRDVARLHACNVLATGQRVRRGRRGNLGTAERAAPA